MEDVLEILGLTKVESKVYIDLVRNGESYAGDIARRTYLNRTNLYDVLQSLKNKGFIFTSHNIKKLFIANPPEILIKKYNENEERIKEIAKELKKESKSSSERTDIKVFEGEDSFGKLLQIILDEKSPIYFYGASLKSFENFGDKYISQLHIERIKNKLPMKILSHKYPKEKLDKVGNIPLTEIKNLPEKYFKEDNTTMFAVSGNKVFIGTQSNPIYVILIHNKQIADNYISFFNMLWDTINIKS